MTALDTNVLLDIAEADVSDIADLLAFIAAVRPPLVVSPVVYTELCAHPGWKVHEVEAFLTGSGIGVAWNQPIAVWRLAGEANARHAARRRRSGSTSPRRIVADFLIGAHAATVGRIVTRDAAFYRRNFPNLDVLEPA